VIFLDINDWQLTARDGSGDVLMRQLAGASSVNGKLEFGAEAAHFSRSHPQQFNNKYIYSLAPDPIAGDLRPAQNHADLIYHHLRALGLPASEPVVLCVGGHLTNQQLGLLLGICKEANLPVLGFIDAALAQSLSVPASDDYHVLDVELHRMTLSRVSVADGQREASQTTTLDGAGAANIVDGWMNVIADEFVQKTRFDPLHAGESEQQLYDQVSAWLSRDEIGDHRVSVTNGNASRDIEVSAALLAEKLDQRLSGFEFEQVQRLVLSPNAKSIPGLGELLSSKVENVTACKDADLADNYQRLAAELDPQEVRRITSIAVDPSGPTAVESNEHAISPQAVATHLLAEHVAYAIDSPRFGPHIDSEVYPGDVLDCDGQRFVAIRLG